MVDEDCFGILNEEDYAAINKALYCLYGSTCLIKYPDYYNPNTRRTMFTGSCSQLARRVAELERLVQYYHGDNPPIDPDYPSDLDWNKIVITPLSGTSGVDIIVPYSASSTVSQTIDINKEEIVPYN